MSSSPTVLVVDDSEVVLTVTKAVLEAAGYRVLTHSGPAGCVAVILQEKPDMVLLDVNMPKLGGETIVKLFGKAQPNSETIVLLFSTLPPEQLKQKALASGAHGFIRKTEDAHELVRHVNRWLRPRGRALSDSRNRAVAPRSSRAPTSGGRRRSVPPQKPGAPPLLPTRPPPRMSGTERILPTVLFIDDDMETLSTFRRDVQGEPYATDFALSVSQAVRSAESSSRPDVMVAVLKPSGVELYRKVVESDETWGARFIFIVPREVDERSKTFLQGFPGIVLRAPVADRELKDAIRRLLPMSTAMRGGREGEGR